MEIQKPFEIELDENVAQGVYSNMVMISFSPSEFVIDFAKILPGLPKAKVQARVLMTPQHAKLLLKALEDNIKQYEAKFGEVKLFGMEQRKLGFAPEEK
ncbi:MAG: DUF3467 domain-containing protein [candidate division WOR-3 bacterium]|jgi:hypothetical protein|uniref:DUF3467 domain-containing protein n=1 Tax=candidate division WOR-3 bacterium TaxID=2052148 RepID=A0A7V3NVN3_UNCW3